MNSNFVYFFLFKKDLHVSSKFLVLQLWTQLGGGGKGMILQSRRNNYSSAVFAKPENVLPAIFVLSSHVRSVLCSFRATDIEALSYLKLWNDVRISLNSSGRQVCVRGSHTRNHAFYCVFKNSWTKDPFFPRAPKKN